MEWFFDGIGSQIVGILLTLFIGGTTGFVIRNKIMQSQKAKNNSIQSQIGNINISNNSGEANEIGDNSLKQVTGKDSTQIQAHNIIVHNGITEERARQIFQEEAKKITAYTQEANITAFERINKLENAFMQAAKKVDGALEAFSDPAFQLILRETEEKAAATEREEDYDLLSQLLICHIQKGSERKNRVGIHHAIKIVDEIDNQALCALTIIYTIQGLVPMAGMCSEGLKLFDDIFSKLQYIELPSGTLWLDHLDILGAIRISNYGKLKSLIDMFSQELDGYVCVGIKKDSPQFEKAMSILSNYEKFGNLLVENECLEGYVRLKLSQKRSANILKLLISLLNNAPDLLSLIPKEINEALYKILDLYSNDPSLMSEAKQNFTKMFNNYEHISKINQWWESIPLAFEITSVGKVLAYTNAKRYDSTIPDLKL